VTAPLGVIDVAGYGFWPKTSLRSVLAKSTGTPRARCAGLAVGLTSLMIRAALPGRG
jgi:hypothetical protein